MCDRIRQARRAASFTQAELARRLGVSPSAVAQWESASGTSPTVANLARIADETHKCFEWLATGRGPRELDASHDAPAVALDAFAHDALEERILLALRRASRRKREKLVATFEELVAKH